MPDLVIEPVAPVIAPAKVVLVPSPPIVRFFVPSETVEPATPASDPMVSPVAVMALMSKTAVEPVNVTRPVSANEPAPVNDSVPSPIIVGPV